MVVGLILATFARCCTIVIFVDHDDVSVVTVVIRLILGACYRLLCLRLLAQDSALLI